jgi:hypothetical protein
MQLWVTSHNWVSKDQLFFVRMLLAVSSGTAEDASKRCHKQEALCSLKNLARE